jgi:hypothetical protein
MGDIKNSCEIYVGKPEKKKQKTRSKHRIIIKQTFKEIKCKDVD